MSNRNQDWTPLGVLWDPVPGDPGHVGRESATMRRSAEAMKSAADNLRRLEAPTTCSEAVTKVLKESSKAATLLSEAGTRYDAAASALSTYAPTLRWAQEESLAALHQAAPARASEAAAYKKSVALYWQARTSIDSAERDHLVTEYHRAKAKRDQASSTLNAAKARLHAAIEARDAAANTAASSIDAASNGGTINDSAWDKFADFVKPLVDLVDTVAQWIWEHIDEIALVLTIAAIALAWVPGLNVVLAALAVGARVLSIAKAGFAVVTSTAEAMKTGNWGPAVLAAAMFGLSFVGGKRPATLASKVGAAAGKKVTAGVTKALRAWNTHLKTGAQARLNHLQHLVIKSQGGNDVIARALNAARTTPYYHRAAGLVDDMHRAANDGVRTLARDADAILATVKGSDYSKAIKEAAEDLAKFGKHHDISESMIKEVSDDIGKAAAVAAEEGVERLQDMAEDKIEEWVADQLDQLDHHRITTTPAGAR